MSRNFSEIHRLVNVFWSSCNLSNTQQLYQLKSSVHLLPPCCLSLHLVLLNSAGNTMGSASRIYLKHPPKSLTDRSVFFSSLVFASVAAIWHLRRKGWFHTQRNKQLNNPVIILPGNIWHMLQECLSKSHSFHIRPLALVAWKQTHCAPLCTCSSQNISETIEHWTQIWREDDDDCLVDWIPSDGNMSSANGAVLPHIRPLTSWRAVPHLFFLSQ